MDDGTFPVLEPILLADLGEEARARAREEVTRLAPEVQSSATFDRVRERILNELLAEEAGRRRATS